MKGVIYMGKTRRIVIHSGSSVYGELQRFNCDLIRRYPSYLHCMLEGFVDAGYSVDDIINGFKLIGIGMTPEYVLKNTVGNLDISRLMLSYYRCGSSVGYISRKFGVSSGEVISLIDRDECLRSSNRSDWNNRVLAGCSSV